MSDLEDGKDLNEIDWLIQNFIATARVYDVLMALLKEQNDAVARDILELHMSGHLIGPMPRMTGVFLTDEMNDEDRKDNLHAGDFDDKDN